MKKIFVFIITVSAVFLLMSPIAISRPPEGGHRGASSIIDAWPWDEVTGCNNPSDAKTENVKSSLDEAGHNEATTSIVQVETPDDYESKFVGILVKLVVYNLVY